MKYSVIIPCYNCMATLETCVQSLLESEVKDFEIVLVDDGSSDGTYELCERLKTRDSRIRVIHKPNGGPSSARNTGIDAAIGDYIVFVDSDDYVDKNYLSAYEYELDNKVAVIFSGCMEENQGMSKPVKVGSKERLVCHRKELLKILLDTRQTAISVAPYGKCFLRSVVGNHRFNERYAYYEDLDFLMQLLWDMEADGMELRIIPSFTYHYIRQENSLSTKPYSKQQLLGAEIFENIYDICLRDEPELADDAKYYYLNYLNCIFYNASAAEATADIKLIRTKIRKVLLSGWKALVLCKNWKGLVLGLIIILHMDSIATRLMSANAKMGSL